MPTPKLIQATISSCTVNIECLLMQKLMLFASYATEREVSGLYPQYHNASSTLKMEVMFLRDTGWLSTNYAALYPTTLLSRTTVGASDTQLVFNGWHPSRNSVGVARDIPRAITANELHPTLPASRLLTMGINSPDTASHGPHTKHQQLS
jgi:hypothetical protein